MPITVTKLPNKDPSASPPSHHINTPPTSFINPWPSYYQQTLLATFLTSRRNRNFKPVPPRDQLVPIRTPDWGIGQQGLKATWIGHASFLVETPLATGAERGIRLLLDPVFSERTSPVQWFGPKRYTPTPCTLEEVPEVDLVVISHDHYDHMDLNTIQQIYKRRRGKIHFLVPLGNAARLQGMGVDKEDATDLDWWESVRVDVPEIGSVTLTCTPAQHLSGRTGIDRMSTLWSSWVLESTLSIEDQEPRTFKLYFAGDTGYRYVPAGASESEVPVCPTFAEIGDKFGPFDLALLPIGLAAPREFMSPVHSNADDALCIHKDLKSRKSIGMHWGTVRGGISQYFEEVTEPPRFFREVCEKAGKVWGEELGLLDVGETAVII